MKKLSLFLIISLFFLGLAHKAEAHFINQSYIYLSIFEDKIEGRFEISIRDLNKALDLSIPESEDWKVVEPYIDQIKAYILKNVAFETSKGPHAIAFQEMRLAVQNVSFGPYLFADFNLEGLKDVPEEINVKNTLIYPAVSGHQSMVIMEQNWKAGIVNNEANFSLLYTGSETEQVLSLSDRSVWYGFGKMIEMGAWHIWIGIDHILFLVALILPSVLILLGSIKPRESIPEKSFPAMFSNQRWQAVDRFRPALLFILKIITFFTISHSITLSLAALEIVVLPARVVESIIALSIALAAVHNIRPIFQGNDWLVAFVFGLFHGFGFASVLGEIGLSGQYLVLSLLGFNLGVELGQIAIICLIFPVLYILRKQKIYSYILSYGSILLIFISLYWFVERSLDMDLSLGTLIRNITGFYI